MLKSWNEMYKLDISKYVKQRDKADYLPWASCLKLLYENGAEKVTFRPLVNENGSSLFMSDQVFANKKGDTNRCYEVSVEVFIDGNTYGISYPVMNGINPVRDELMNQNAVHKAQMRAFVKCVAINTGLGFDLWADDADLAPDEEDLSKHNLWAIKERTQILYTKLIKQGMSTKDIATAMNKSEEEVRLIFTFYDQLDRLEKELQKLQGGQRG